MYIACFPFLRVRKFLLQFFKMVQMANVFSQPLEQFLREDIKQLKEETKLHQRLRTKYDQTLARYSHVKKAEIEKIQEVNQPTVLSPL